METFLSKPQPAVQIQSQWDKLLTEWQGRVLKYIPQCVTSIPAHFHSGLTLNSRNKGLKRFLNGFPKPGVRYVIWLKEMKHIPKGPDCITLYLEHTYTKETFWLSAYRQSFCQACYEITLRPNKKPIWNQTYGVLSDGNFLNATRKIIPCKWSRWKNKTKQPRTKQNKKTKHKTKPKNPQTEPALWKSAIKCPAGQTIWETSKHQLSREDA